MKEYTIMINRVVLSQVEVTICAESRKTALKHVQMANACGLLNDRWDDAACETRESYNVESEEIA